MTTLVLVSRRDRTLSIAFPRTHSTPTSESPLPTWRLPVSLTTTIHASRPLLALARALVALILALHWLALAISGSPSTCSQRTLLPRFVRFASSLARPLALSDPCPFALYPRAATASSTPSFLTIFWQISALHRHPLFSPKPRSRDGEIRRENSGV